MQKIEREKLRGAVSFVLMGLNDHLHDAQTKPEFVARAHPVMRAVFVPIYAGRETKEFRGFEVSDTDAALESLNGLYGPEVAGMATLYVRIMIRFRNPFPDELLNWIGDVLAGRSFTKASKDCTTLLGRDLLLRHLTKVGATMAGCPITSKNSIVTGARIVQECAGVFGVPIGVGTSNRILGSAKNDSLVRNLDIDIRPNKIPDTPLHRMGNLVVDYCAETAGLGDKLSQVLGSLTELESVQIL